MVSSKIILGEMLVLVVLTTSFYLMMPDKVRVNFLKTNTEFNVWNGSEFILGGVEYIRIFDGSKLMRANERNMDYILSDGITTAIKTANFKDNIRLTETFIYHNNATRVEDLPISHQICFENAQGKIFEYLISKIGYGGETKEITSPFSFENNMKVTFQDGYYLAKVYQNK